MIGNKSVKFLRKLSSRDIYPAIYIAVITAAITTFKVIWELSHLFHEYNKSIAAGAEVQISMDMPWMHIRIVLGTILSAVGLCLRSVKGLLISMLALAWVGIEYLSWYLWSLRIKENAGVEEFSPLTPHAWNIYGAESWNIAVLVVVAALFIWEIKILINLLLLHNNTRRSAH